MFTGLRHDLADEHHQRCTNDLHRSRGAANSGSYGDDNSHVGRGRLRIWIRNDHDHAERERVCRAVHGERSSRPDAGLHGDSDRNKQHRCELDGFLFSFGVRVNFTRLDCKRRTRNLYCASHGISQSDGDGHGHLCCGLEQVRFSHCDGNATAAHYSNDFARLRQRASRRHAGFYGCG